MDFISNLIKRPISLVLNETSDTTDKISISASSLPNTPSNLDTKSTAAATNESQQEQQQQQQQKHLLNNNNNKNNNNRPLSMSSSFNGASNITDFIGVPEEFLGEFEDILPPPPPLAQSPLNMAEYNRSLSITPPPPLTPAMKASQTIDELLLEINDNLQQAGLNDDTLLAIASPPNNAELSPLSSKAGLNNSKSNTSSHGNAENYTSKTPTTNVTTTSQTPATAAGSAAANAATVFEANSSIHKFHIDPELETGLFDDQHQQHPQELQQPLNNSGVNKSSNKFVGLTEFDEAKIPELPGDLNPNIEEQYNVTFEECFIPTLTAQHSTKAPDEFIVDKTHLLLPTETDTAVSSDNETFADCQDEEKDPLANTFAEQTCTLDTTTDMESYQSANNSTINFQISNTMDNINDITMEAEFPLQQAQQTQVVEELKQTVLPQYEAMDEDEPMDIDMNATMEMIQTSSSNIQHVEQVLQHAENILQHIEEKKPLQELEKPLCESSKMSFVVNTPMESNKSQHLEMEYSNHELSLNKSIELPLNNSKNVSSECIIKMVNNEEQQQESEKEVNDNTLEKQKDITGKELSKTELSDNQLEIPKELTEKELSVEELSKKELSDNQLETPTITAAPEVNQSSVTNNLTIDCMNSSASSLSSLKSSPGRKPETKLNLTLGMSSSMTSSQKSSAPSSPAFPLKHSQSAGFPRSPKAIKENEQHSPFLEKSDYFETHNQASKSLTQLRQDNAKNLNKTFEELKTSAGSMEQLTSKTNNLNGTFVEPLKTVADNLNGTYVEQSATIAVKEAQAENLNGTYVELSSADLFNKDLVPSEVKKVTENQNPLEFKIPSTQNKRLTFGVDSLNEETTLEKFPQHGIVPDSKRRTFNLLTLEPHLDSVEQFPSLDKPDNSRRTFSLNEMEKNSLQDELSTSRDNMKPRRTFNVSAEESVFVNTSFEPMEIDESEALNTTMPVNTNEEQRSQSPALPNMQQKSQSPAPANMKEKFQSPPLANMREKSLSPPLPTMMEKSQSPLPAMQQKSQSPPLPAMQQKSQSPPLPAMQQKSQSPPLPAMQQKSQSPPLPTMFEKSLSPPLPAKPTIKANENSPKSDSPPPLPPRILHKPVKKEPLSSLSESSSASPTEPFQLPFSKVEKRPSIHEHAARIRGDTLSAKEQSNNKIQDEKDIFVDKFTPSPIEDIFTAVTATSTTLTNSSGFSDFEQNSSSTSTSLVNNAEQLKQQEQLQFDDEEFQGNNNLIFNPSDFDYLLTKGNNNTPVDRSSLLLKFDPLLGVPVPVNQGQQQQLQQLQLLQIPTNIINPCLSPTLEEDEHNDSNRSFVIETKPTTGLSLPGQTNGASAKLLKERTQEVKQELQLEQKPQQQQEQKQQLEQQLQQQNKRQLTQGGNKKNATMSVDVIKDINLDNDCNKTFENSNSTQSDDKQINYKMDELEKKIKNEVLKTEDIEKKLKDAEQREEALIKRITEKDKTVSKMNGVIEAYEKAIAELIAEKEQLIQNYEKQLAEVKADRDSNYHHLTSLETTFSDLHVKYEKSKEMTCQLKANEDVLATENRKTLENLRLQEQRYDKMKNHAMQQLEIANKKLESLTRDHAIESTKLKALLKKEEIARSSINEQLAQKTKENAELVKICDELISGQGS